MSEGGREKKKKKKKMERPGGSWLNGCKESEKGRKLDIRQKREEDSMHISLRALSPRRYGLGRVFRG